MAETIPDILVTSTAWVDINTESGIAVGTKMQITNKSITWVRAYEGTTAPLITSEEGELLTHKPYQTSTVIIPAGSLKIWALCSREGRSSKLLAQEL